MRSLDVVIIGGSLAGAACARSLARRGIEAVAFERGSVPREKVCGGFLSPGAVACLEQLDLLDAARLAGAQKVTAARVRTPGGEVHFELRRPGLGISRWALDALVAAGSPVERGAVRSVLPAPGGFVVEVDDVAIQARVVIDAAGKLSRFTPRRSESEFGVQFYEDGMAGPGTLEFWFFRGGYGGAVGVEGNRTNCSFLLQKDALDRFRSKPGCRVTGPLAYTAGPSPWLAIGDAAGMIDPFCGEGMRHALDTAEIAAAAVARGLADGRAYEDIRRAYDAERRRRWGLKRAAAAVLRAGARRPGLSGLVLGRRTERLVRGVVERLWA